jgi:ketosteroid isomerase-like protein
MNTIAEKINHVNQLIQEGKLMDAFEMYYDDEVVMQENAMEPTVGKAANRRRELQFLNDVTEFRGARAMHVAAADTISYVTWEFDYTHKDWGVRNYTQVSVQHWKDGKIVREQFFYGS